MKKKTIYLLGLMVIALLGVIISPTYAKFTSGFTTEEDVVGMTLSFNLGISNVEEYEEIILEKNTYEIFHVEITNATSDEVYYGVWYKMVNPTNITDDIIIARLEGTETTTSGTVTENGTQTVTIIIINKSKNDIKINIGVGSSSSSTSDIEYLGGKYLITGTSSIPYFSDHIQNLYNDGTTLKTVNIGSDTSKPTVTQNTTQKIMLDNNGEYRYYGSDPNNYVEFNNELWRIISVSNVKSEEDDTTGTMKVKLMREEPLGKYSWDSSDSTINFGYGINEWKQADAMTLLNDLYYNNKSGTCYNGSSNASTTCDFTSTGLSDEAKNLISDSLWYLGGKEISIDMYPNDYYDFERGTNTYSCSTEDNYCPRSTTWTGEIGLLYASDYMYAADLNTCTKVGYSEDGSSYDYRDTTCTENNWLYSDSGKWTMTVSSGLAYHAFLIYYTGEIHATNTYPIFGLHPVAYLRSDVIVSGGTGTSTDPYQLSES